MLDRGQLVTERHHAQALALEGLDTRAAVAQFTRVDREALAAVEGAEAPIARAVDAIAMRLARNGRLIYIGAGTSGRLAALDAAECPPTFQSDPSQVQAILAGGAAAMFGAVEGAEDDEACARQALIDLELGAGDVLLGISAGGTTAFVGAALREGRARGALTIFLACVPQSQVPAQAELEIRLDTGPELISGSTRLKAGTATKLVLNTISTLVMVRLGKTYKNRMVDVDSRANAKLVDRAERLVMELLPCERERARHLLAAAHGQVKVALVMGRCGKSMEAARELLLHRGGSLERVFAEYGDGA